MSAKLLRRPSARAMVIVLLLGAAALGTGASRAQALPAGFQESVAFSGLTQPTQVRFAADGRVFVAEKSGLIKVFDGLGDTTPTVFADLRTQVYNFWDRGLLGMTLDPDFTAGRPYVYALYTHDAAIGGTAPRWGTAGATSDPCPSPPGASTNGCVVSGRLSRLTASGNTMTGSENVLVEDWCQQFPSHSVGTLAFGADGALYVTHGEGAKAGVPDWGQHGDPLNPCGDPPGGVGSALTPPTAEGGSLRSQDLRTSGDPVGLHGALLRLDPNTGAGLADNPLASSPDANARRIVAYGMRNPFRFAIRPGTSDVWIGDVGSQYWDEINRVPDPVDGTVENFGWPCYEGGARHSGWDGANLQICEDLYAQSGAVTQPFFKYDRPSKIVPGETCPTGNNTISGLAWGRDGGGAYPSEYDGALFFADYSRNCIWAMRRGSDNLPNPSAITTFVAPATNPVDLQISPAGELFYVDFDGGTVRRIRYTGTANQPPTAVATATPRNGPAPLTVDFSATSSSDPDAGDSLTYAWDLDGDGAYDDASSATASYIYEAGQVTVGLRVTDRAGLSDTDTVTINSGTSAPTATIASPSAATAWKAGDTISFSGSATDPDDGALPASRLSWSLALNHCPSICHSHPLETFDGVATGSFTAPDHEYPSHLELQLTATDSSGLTDTQSVAIHPQTVDLTFRTSPAGLSLAVNDATQPTPFTRKVIVGSSNSVSAVSPQSSSGTSYSFSSWSDGGPLSHTVVAPAAATTYTATYTTCPIGQYRAQYFANRTLSGTPVLTRCETRIANAWGNGGPGNGVPSDNFSVRWIGAFPLAEGIAHFETRTSDGMRVWLGPSQVINQWRDQGATRYRASRTVAAGTHTIKVEYYEATGAAVAEVTRSTCGPGQFVAQLYANRTLTGAPRAVRCDAAINFNWGTGGPGNGLPTNSFSIRWTARPTFSAGSHRFTVRTDDGARLYVDGALVINAWKNQGPTTYTATRTLTEGQHEIRVEYYDNSGGAVAQVSWARL